MARSTPVSMPDHELHWSNTHENTHSTFSDASFTEPVRHSPPPMSTWIKPSTPVLHTGHLSPVSPGRDSASSASPAVNSTSLSYTDTWSVEGMLRDDASTPWTEDGGLAPKLEVDEEFGGLLDVPAVETRDFEAEDPRFADGRGELGTQRGSRKVDDKSLKKKPRGRPRKHPLAPLGGLNKTAKPRSKTGCITCRKRKKKCDEAKPRCMNCEKNAVVCEGYHEKQMWKSGKERAEEARLSRSTLPAITMPPIFHGVETPEDKVFWRHYCNHLSNVLTVESEHRNAFKDIVLRLATRHQGLMHSVLSLSARHIDYETPYGMKILDDGPGEMTLSSLRDRAEYHHEEAMACLYADMRRSEDPADPEYKTVLMARYGQMLCLLLKTMVEGNPRGDHRVHLQAYRRLMHHSPPEDPDFRDFITEFFEYYIFADELLSPPGPEGRMAEYLTSSLSTSPSSPHEPRLVGVTDGLFTYMSQITAIRDTIRENIRSGADHAVDYPSLYRAAEIDAAVRDWSPCWPAGDSRNRLALLYKQAVWVYLFRTIYPPCEGRGQREDGATSTESESEFGGDFGSEEVSGASASGDTSTPSPTSPRTRTPDLQDPRITTALNGSLALLETFKPSDPSQTLLLIPCLLLGTACFEPEQQGKVRRAVGRVRGYTGLRNCDLLVGVLEGVWGAMGRGEWRGVWEWEAVARGMGVDFLCA